MEKKKNKHEARPVRLSEEVSKHVKRQSIHTLEWFIIRMEQKLGKKRKILVGE